MHWADVGQYPVTVVASDVYGGVGNVTTTLVVNSKPGPGPAFSSWTNVTTTPIGVWFTTTIPPGVFVDADGDAVKYSLVDKSRATWLSLAADGVTLSGTPSVNTHSSVAVVVGVSDGRGGSDVFTVELVTPNTAPVVKLGAEDRNVTVGVVRVAVISSDAFGDADGDALLYAVTGTAPGRSVPTFVSVTGSSVVLSPRSGDQGRYEMALTASDSWGGFATSPFAVVVDNRPPRLAYPIPAAVHAVASVPWSCVIEAGNFVDDDGDALQYASTSTVSGSALPRWLTFDGQRRQWSGQPSGVDRGTVVAVVIVSDGHGGVTSGTVAITVANSPPTYVGRVFDQQV